MSVKEVKSAVTIGQQYRRRARRKAERITARVYQVHRAEKSVRMHDLNGEPLRDERGRPQPVSFTDLAHKWERVS